MLSDTLTIIPAYNEGNNICEIISQLKCRYPEMPILVVDDGSQDNTREMALAHHVAVISHPFNLGYGAAIQTGYKYALEQGFSFLAQIDADGQHEVEDILSLIEPVKQGHCDLALGSRFLHADSYKPSLMRQIGICFFRRITSLLTGQALTDPTSGFQAMNSKVLNILTRNEFPTDYPDADVLVMLYYYGTRIKEIPVRMHSSQGNSMHRGWWRPLYYMGKLCLSLIITCSLKNDFRKANNRAYNKKPIKY